jgi:AraC family transcriptional regulator
MIRPRVVLHWKSRMAQFHPEIRPVPARRGDLVRAVTAGPFQFSESHHRAPLAMHVHERPTITILLHGAFVETLRRRVIEARAASSVLFRPAGEPHADRFGTEGAVNLVIEIEPSKAESLRGYSARLDEVACLRGPGFDALTQRMRGELRASDGLAPLALEGLALELIAAATRDPRRSRTALPPWLKRVRELLDARFNDSALRMSDLALEANVHPVHLARVFRRCLGLSPTDYLRRLRVEWAARQITSSHRTLAEIADEAGFFDQSHLTRAFRRTFGVTPGQFRRGE